VLIQNQPLRSAVTASAGRFILETLLAKVLLKENVGALRTTGALLVFIGIVMVAH
jgi:uncharacterized membrane protein